MRGGHTDYYGGIVPQHPFFLRRPTLHQRDLYTLEQKSRRWQWYALVGVCLIICNGLLAFWLLTVQKPVVFVDTVLHSGEIYQQGVFVKGPLSQQKSQDILMSGEKNVQTSSVIRTEK